MEWYQEMHRDAVCCAEYCAAWSIHYHLQWLSLCTVWFSEVFNLYHATNLFLDFIYSWLFLFQSELSKCETQAKLSKAHYHQKEYIYIWYYCQGTLPKIDIRFCFRSIYHISLFWGIHSVHHLVLYLPCVSHPIVVVIHGTVCASGFKHLKPCSRWWGGHIAAGDSGRLRRSSNWFYRNWYIDVGVYKNVYNIVEYCSVLSKRNLTNGFNDNTHTHKVRSHSLFGRNFLDPMQSQENSIHTWV